MIEFTQIGWFDPASKRFCYTDEKKQDEKRDRKYHSGYTHPVFSIDPETAKRLSVQIKGSNIRIEEIVFLGALGALVQGCEIIQNKEKALQNINERLVELKGATEVP